MDDDDEFGTAVWSSAAQTESTRRSDALNPDSDFDSLNQSANFLPNYSSNYSSNYNLGGTFGIDNLSLGNTSSTPLYSQHDFTRQHEYNDNENNENNANLLEHDPLRRLNSEPSYQTTFSQYSVPDARAADAWGEDMFSSAQSYQKPVLAAGIATTTTITPTPAVFDPLANIGNTDDETDESQDNLHSQQLDEQEYLYEFQVSVSEPQKVGNEFNGHILYKVSTWLVERYPGAIVHPLPGKEFIGANINSDYFFQTIFLSTSFLPLFLGRFQEEFVEARRFGLDKFLKKVVTHSLLQQDADLRLFLESNSFSADKKESRAKTFLNISGLDSSAAMFAFTANAGRILDDQFLESRRYQIELSDEVQLKTLLKAITAMIKQRRDVGFALNDFGDALIGLSAVESGKEVGRNLAIVGEIQKKIRELYDKQANLDLINLASTIEENVRVIGSIRVAFAGRMKVFTFWQNADIALKKKKESIERMRGNTKVKWEEISAGLNNLPDLEAQVAATRENLQKVTDLMHKEIKRYDTERVEDFIGGIKKTLKSFYDIQMEIIRLWESYYELSGQEVPGKSDQQ
ncbi:sorting nexin-2 [Physocladia obscura]|uniref:Sorting nexin-2 n=1 Tax=Physocladia obscura TaxID=109957 RepID=A0AAD5STE0_9FUNG|nr:sorting nexin-2 [Physocladia obscura]